MSLDLHSDLESISSKIDKMDEALKDFSKDLKRLFIIPSFYCFLYYDVKTAEKDEEMFVDIVNRFIDYILTYKEERAKLEKQYIDTAVAITASKGETVEPKTLDLDCLYVIMIPLYKIIKTIEYSDLIEDGLWVKTIDKTFNKDDLVRNLKEVYGYLKEGISEKLLEIIERTEKSTEKYIKDNIDSLRPSDSYRKTARETIVRLRKAYETAKEDSPVFEPEPEAVDDSTSEEEALAALTAEEDLEFADEDLLSDLEGEEDLEFADEAPPVEDDSPSSSASTAEGEMVGSTGLISAEDLTGIAKQPKEIIIRNRGKDEPIESYEEYLKKIYQGIGFFVQKENGMRKRYPHEEDLFQNGGIITTSEGKFSIKVDNNREISDLNSYDEYRQYIETKEAEISNIKDVIDYLKSHLNEEYPFYYMYITQLIEILSNSEKQKSLPEHYKVDLSISLLFVTKTFTIYVSPDAIKDINDGKLKADNLNGIIGAINSDSFEIPYIKSMKIINKELCKDEPLTISGDSEDDTTPVEEDILPGVAPEADDYTSEDTEASEEDGFTHEDVVAPAEGEDSSSTKKDKVVRKRAPRITVPKSKKEIETIITYKYSIYKMIVSELIKEEKEISKENFRSVLKNLCDNQPDNVRFKLEFDKNSDEYILVSEEDGEKQTMTISYSGFITSTSARFKPINDKQEYETSDKTSKISLNLRNIAPEKVDRNKAIIYTCLTDAKISVNSKKLVITRFIRQLLAKYQAKVNIYYKLKQSGVKAAYGVDFNETDENEDITLPLTNRDPREPIEIEVYLKNDKRITISLEPVAGAKRLKI